MYYNIKTNPSFKDIKLKYFEFDLPIVIKSKIKKIRNSKLINQVLGECKIDD